MGTQIEKISSMELVTIKRDPIQQLDDAIEMLQNGTNRIPSRWNRIDLGLLQTIISKCFKNLSKKCCVISTIVCNIIFSVFDTCSDLVVAFTLFAEGKWEYGLVVLMLDYVPGWELLIHNLFSKNWREQKNTKQKYITIVFLIISPFSLPLFYINWMIAFECADEPTFNYLHHNSRLAQLLNGSVESPLQVLMLLVLWAEKLLPLPWSVDTTFVDLQGNILDFGILPAVVSLAMSSIVILKGSIEITESSRFEEVVLVVGYALCNFVFRLSSFALAIIYFKVWSIVLFVTIFVVNFICILRYDEPKRKDFSIITSTIISIFTPFISSDQPHKYQLVSKHYIKHERKSQSMRKRNLSGRMAIVTFPMILICDLALLFNLKRNSDFKYGDINLTPETTETILYMLVFPAGFAALITSIVFYKQRPDNPNRLKGTVQRLNQKITRCIDSYIRYSLMISSVILVIVMGVVTLDNLPKGPETQGRLRLT